MLSFTNTQVDYVQLGALLVAGMTDCQEKSYGAALEGFAVAHSKLGPAQFQALLASLRLQPAAAAAVSQRLRNPALPSINAEGMLEHASEISMLLVGPPPDSASSSSSAAAAAAALRTDDAGSRYSEHLRGDGGPGPGSGTASPKLPWEVPRPRSRTRAASGIIPPERILDWAQEGEHATASLSRSAHTQPSVHNMSTYAWHAISACTAPCCVLGLVGDVTVVCCTS
jgi:hypothetical protein